MRKQRQSFSVYVHSVATDKINWRGGENSNLDSRIRRRGAQQVLGIVCAFLRWSLRKLDATVGIDKRPGRQDWADGENKCEIYYQGHF